MKKLTWLFLSLMLFLGMGTAFVRADETWPVPTFTPASGSTVAPGTMLEFTLPSGIDDSYMGAVVMYVENNDEVEFGTDADVILAAAQEDAGYSAMTATAPKAGERLWKTAMYMPDDEVWWTYVSISAEATGTVKLRMRLVTVDYDNNTQFSDEFTATYTISSGSGAVEKPAAPTFDPAAGAVAAGTKIKILGGNPAGMLIPYYIIDGSDEDFDLTFDELQSPTCKLDSYYGEADDIEVAKAITVKAAMAKINTSANTVVWSDIATATYTIKGEEPVTPTPADKPATPVFNPNGGEVTLSTEIALSTTTTAATIYYTMDIPGETSIPDFSAIETEENLEQASFFIPYDDPFTLETFGVSEEDLAAGDVVMGLKAAAALIGTDGNITWSDEAKATFTVKASAPADGVATPVISPKDVFVNVGDLVTITCATEDATIYYTTDGSDPAEAPEWMLEEYSAPFAISAYNVKDNGEYIVRVIAKKGDASATARTTLMINAAVPEIEAEEVFGSVVDITSTTYNAKIYYTLDGSTPTEKSLEYSYSSRPVLTKSMTVKAIAVYPQSTSDVATAEFTVAPAEDAVVTLSPVQDENTVGYNVATGISINNGTLVSEQWIQRIPAYVYYTTDGKTVPSKADYDKQADKENGAIKMVSVKWEEQVPVQDNNGNFMALTFTEATHLKAVGYLMDGNNVLVTTALFDQELQIKAEAEPELSIKSYAKVAVGDQLVIKNPNVYPERPEMPEYPEWPGEDATEEEMAAYNEAVAAWYEELDKYDEEFAAWQEATAPIPATQLYFSFDGTKPTEEAYFNNPEEYADWSVFRGEEGENVTVYFQEDEQGLYAYVPRVATYFPTAADTIRLGADGVLSVQVLAISTAKEEGGDEPMPLSARAAGGAAFKYASDYVTAYYTMKDEFAVEAPAFSVAAGEVEKGTKVAITCATEGAVIYYTVDGTEPTAASAEYKEAIVINEAMTIKAIAVKYGLTSKVATAAYTIKPASSANEDLELAGVSVYPNPSNGQFNLELPVAATVEVFAINGVLMQRMEANAGNVTLNINRSGIYFLRITGEGRTTVKRLIIK